MNNIDDNKRVYVVQNNINASYTRVFKNKFSAIKAMKEDGYIAKIAPYYVGFYLEETGDMICLGEYVDIEDVD